jgi:MFS family permease
MTETTSPPTSSRVSMDGIPWTRPHLLAAVCTLGGTTLDDYILGLSGAAVSGAEKEMTFGALSAGPIGASALIGIFIGGVLFGQAADRWGRRPVFQWNLVAFVIFSVAQLFTVGVAELMPERAVPRRLIQVGAGAPPTFCMRLRATRRRADCRSLRCGRALPWLSNSARGVGRCTGGAEELF